MIERSSAVVRGKGLGIIDNSKTGARVFDSNGDPHHVYIYIYEKKILVC